MDEPLRDKILFSGDQTWLRKFCSVCRMLHYASIVTLRAISPNKRCLSCPRNLLLILNRAAIFVVPGNGC